MFTTKICYNRMIMRTPNTINFASRTPEVPASARSILVAPGFTWGESSLRQLLDELGSDAFLADYYGKGPQLNKKQLKEFGIEHPDRTDVLAGGLLLSIKERELEDTPIDVVAHSYGALIYDRAHDHAKRLGWGSLAPEAGDSRAAVLLAPSGSQQNEAIVRLMTRYLKNLGGLALETGLNQAFRDQQTVLLSHPFKRLAEATRLGHDMVDYEALANDGINVHVVQAYGDKVFPASRYESSLADEPLASWESVINKSATHNEPLLNASRTAAIIRSILQ